MTDELSRRDLIGIWFRQARETERIHYRIGSRMARYNSALTAVVVVSSTVVGSSLFSLLSKNPGHNWTLALASASVASAVLVAMQKSLNLGDIAERNRSTGSGWQRILNKATASLTIPDGDPRLDAAISDLEKMIDDVVAASPQIPERDFKKSELPAIYAELERYAKPQSPHVG